MQPVGERNREVLVLGGIHASRPRLDRIVLANPGTDRVVEPPERLVPLIESRLSLRLNDEGLPRPVRLK